MIAKVETDKPELWTRYQEAKGSVLANDGAVPLEVDRLFISKWNDIVVIPPR